MSVTKLTVGMRSLLSSKCFPRVSVAVSQACQRTTGSYARLMTFSSCLNKRQNTHLNKNQRSQHTVSQPGSFKDTLSVWQTFKWNMGLYGKLQVPDRVLRTSAFNLYICCTDFIDVDFYLKELELEDSFTSWFLLLQLHLWLLYVKFSQMGKEGALLTHYMYDIMWQDVQRRLDTFKELRGSEKREAMKDYYSALCLSVMYYDEGILGSDQELANALWVQLYGMNNNVKAEKLELIVEYVRKQVHHLDGMDAFPIMKPGFVSLLPLYGDQVDPKKRKRDLQTLLEK